MWIKQSILLLLLILLVDVSFAQTSRWRVVWNPNPPTDSVAYYEVYIGSDSNSVNLVGTVNHPGTEYRDSLGIGGVGLNPGQIYYYKIKAVNQHGSGPFSDAAYASIPEINFSQLSLLNNADTTFNLNQPQFVNDPDFGINQLEWDVQDLTPGDSIEHFMINSNTIQFITPNDTTIQDLLQFRVFDSDSFYDESSVTIDLTSMPTNLAPIVTGIPNQTIDQGQSFTQFDLDNYVTDPDNNLSELTWTRSGENNLTVQIGSSSHIVTVLINDTNWVGSETITFRATDPGGLFDEDDATFTINAAVPVAPVVSGIPDQTILQGEIFNTIDLDQFVTDADNDTSELVWTVTGENNLSVNIDAISHVATITANNANWAGSETITFRATDPTNLWDEDAAEFTILAGPVVSGIPDQTILLGETFNTIDLDQYVTDADHDTSQLTWTVSGENNLAVNIDPVSHIASITANNANWAGSETITFRVTDPNDLFDEDLVVFTIQAPPVVSGISDQTIEQGESFTVFDLDEYVTDADNDTSELTWTTSGNTNLDVYIDTLTHEVTITPSDTNWVGSEPITFRATDPDGLWGEDIGIFSINQLGNRSPWFTSEPIEEAKAGEVYTYLATAFDPDGDSLTFSLIASPVFLGTVIFNDTSSYISGTPPLETNEVFSVTILVSDGRGGDSTQVYELNVSPSLIERSVEIYAYPAPFVASKSPVPYITFNNLPLNSRLVLYNLLGEPVFSQKVDSQPYLWYIKNNSGLDVQSGLYFYYVKDGNKVLSSGKIVIIR